MWAFLGLNSLRTDQSTKNSCLQSKQKNLLNPIKLTFKFSLNLINDLKELYNKTCRRTKKKTKIFCNPVIHYLKHMLH